MEKVDKQGAKNAAYTPNPFAFARYGNVKCQAFIIL
jgi:hypothetical protein